MVGAPKNNINAVKGLNLKQKRFCMEYIIDNNATQAAIRSGYSKKTAAVIGAENLTKPNIKEEIDKLQDKTSKKLEITHEMLTAEWAKMAFSSISHLHNSWIELTDFEHLKETNPNILDCIQEINYKTETAYKHNQNLDKKEAININYVKLKLYDKQKALENLGKRIGYYAEDNKQKQIIQQITGMEVK